MLAAPVEMTEKDKAPATVRGRYIRKKGGKAKSRSLTYVRQEQATGIRDDSVMQGQTASREKSRSLAPFVDGANGFPSRIGTSGMILMGKEASQKCRALR